jgi:hypothetical protein
MGFQNKLGHKEKGIFGRLNGPPAPVYGPYTIAYAAEVVSRGGVVTNAEKGYLTTFENSLGLDLAQFDRLWIFGIGNNIAARTSFVNPTSTAATAVNGPTFTPNLGYTGNGTTSYVNSNFNVKTQGVQYTANRCAMFVYIQQNVIALRCAMGAFTGSNEISIIYPQYTLGQGLYYLNNNSPDSLTLQNSIGLSSCRRINPTETQGFKNGIASGPINLRAVTNMPNTNMYILAQSNSGGATALYPGTMSACGMGGNNYNQLNFYNSLQALATSLGWNV